MNMQHGMFGFEKEQDLTKLCLSVSIIRTSWIFKSTEL